MNEVNWGERVNVEMVSFSCGGYDEEGNPGPVTNERQKAVVINEFKAVINRRTFVWAEGDSWDDSGKIQIAGDTDIVKILANQICQEPQLFTLPAGKDLFPPVVTHIGWKKTGFGEGRLDVNVLRDTLTNLKGAEAKIYIPIEDWDFDTDLGLLRLFAIINGQIYLRADLSGYEIFGEPKERVDSLVAELGKGQQFGYTLI